MEIRADARCLIPNHASLDRIQLLAAAELRITEMPYGTASIKHSIPDMRVCWRRGQVLGDPRERNEKATSGVTRKQDIMRGENGIITPSLQQLTKGKTQPQTGKDLNTRYSPEQREKGGGNMYIFKKEIVQYHGDRLDHRPSA